MLTADADAAAAATAKEKERVTTEEVTVAGRMSLSPASDEGLFYSLADAHPAPRVGG